MSIYVSTGQAQTVQWPRWHVSKVICRSHLSSDAGACFTTPHRETHSNKYNYGPEKDVDTWPEEKEYQRDCNADGLLWYTGAYDIQSIITSRPR